jgi:hypothetical protein
VASPSAICQILEKDPHSRFVLCFAVCVSVNIRVCVCRVSVCVCLFVSLFKNRLRRCCWRSSRCRSKSRTAGYVQLLFVRLFVCSSVRGVSTKTHFKLCVFLKDNRAWEMVARTERVVATANHFFTNISEITAKATTFIILLSIIHFI